MALSWPKGIGHDTRPRSQFHHVNDIVPTIYDVLDIDPPLFVSGVAQHSFDGVSMRYTFADAQAEGRKKIQFFEVQRTKIRSRHVVPAGKATIEVESRLVDKIGGPMDITLRVNGTVVGRGRVPAAMSLHLTSNATFDIGTDNDSPVSLDYYNQAPFAFNGSIGKTTIKYLGK
jgi:hypothetical protein